MTQEDKQLLLKDLCGRLPYGVKMDFYARATNEHYVSILLGIEPDSNRPVIAKVNDGAYTLGQDHIKPYLRPMSSMTEEEKEEFYMQNSFTTETFCNAHHLDYRGLIPMGLALEAREGMYKEDQQ